MIPKIEFDDLIVIQDWAEALRKILAAATEAIRDENSSDRVELQGLLLTYIKKSPPKVEVLDVVAREAIDDLAIAEISAALERIASRNLELERATGLIGAVSSEAKKDARALQLESTFEALAKAKKAVEAFRKLEESLTNPDGTLLTRLKAVAGAIAEVSALAPAATPR